MQVATLHRVSSVSALAGLSLPAERISYMSDWLAESSSHIAFYSSDAIVRAGEALPLTTGAPVNGGFRTEGVRSFSDLKDHRHHFALVHLERVNYFNGTLTALLTNKSSFVNPITIQMAVVYLAVRTPL